MPAGYEKWFSRNDVKSVSYLNSNRLGGGMSGDVYAGHLTLNDGRRKRVAVKEFSFHITRKDVLQYEAAIKRLVSAGVRVPKTGFVFHPHSKRWVQVQELFGSVRRRKFDDAATPNSVEEAADFGRQLARINNAGMHYPIDAGGVLEKSGGGRTFYLFDLDGMVPAIQRDCMQDSIDDLEEYYEGRPKVAASRKRAIASLAEIYQAVKPEHRMHALETYYGELVDGRLSRSLKKDGELHGILASN